MLPFSFPSFFVVNMKGFDFPSYLPQNMRVNIKGNIFVGNNEANCTTLVLQDHIKAHLPQSSCGVTVVDVAIDVSKLLNKKKPTLYYQLPLCVEFI